MKPSTAVTIASAHPISTAGIIPALCLATLVGFSQNSLPAQGAAADAGAPESETVILNPFVVSTANDTGYGTAETTIGNRSTKEVSDLPIAVYVANRQLISDLDADRSFQVFRYSVAGASETNEENDDSNFRGFRSPYQMRDDILFTTNRQNPMFDVDRVEFLKGPAAMVLGNIAYVGGIANFVTKEPTEKMMGDVTVGVQDESGKAVLTTDLNQSGPITQSKDFSALYRFTFGSRNGDQPKADQTVDQLFYGGGVMLKFFDNRVIVDTRAFYWMDNDFDYYNDFLDLSRSPSVPYVLAGTNLPTAHLNPYSTPTFSFAGGPQIGPSQYEHTRTKYVQSVVTMSLTKNAFLRLSYTGEEYIDYRNFIRGITLQPDNVTDSMQQYLQSYDFPSQTLQGDFLYRTTTQWFKNEFSMGVEGDWSKNDSGSVEVVPPNMNTANPQAFYTTYVPNSSPINLKTFQSIPGGVGGVDTGAISTGGSWWLQDNLSLLDNRLIIVDGYRWVHSVVNTENFFNGTWTAQENPQIRTYRFGLVGKPIDHLSLYYVSMDNVSPNPGLDEFGNPFIPSFGKDNEYGFKVDFSNARFHLYGSFANYFMVLTNVKVSFVDPNVPGGVALAQVASNAGKGWETEWGARLNLDCGHADLLANYEHVSTVSALTDSWNAETPNWIMSVFGTFTFTATPLGGLTVGGGMYHQGPKISGNSYLVKDPPIYSVLARYAINKHLSVQINGDNITNEYYIDSIAASGLVLTGHTEQWRLATKFVW